MVKRQTGAQKSGNNQHTGIRHNRHTVTRNSLIAVTWECCKPE